MRTLPLIALVAACSPKTLPSPTPEVQPITELAVVLQDAVDLPNGAGPMSLGDIDGDGFTDAVFPVSGDEVHWARADGVGGLSLTRLFSTEALLDIVAADLTPGQDATAENLTIHALDLADMDGDGRDDLAMRLSLTEDGVVQTIAGVLYAPATFPVWSTLIEEDARASTVVADLDGDGLPEWVHMGLDAAVFTSGGEVWPLVEAFSAVQYPRALTFDTDAGPVLGVFIDYAFGITEIQTYRVERGALTLVSDERDIYAQDVIGNAGPNAASSEALLVTGEDLLRFDGTAWNTAMPSDVSGFLSVLGAGDVTGDGRVDLITYGGEAGPALFASAEGGTLQPMSFEAPTWQAAWIGVADANADGFGDLWVVSYRDDGVVLELWQNAG